MDELAKKRADTAKDCRLWPPLDALEDAADRIRAETEKGNKVQVCVWWWIRFPDDTRELQFSVANLTYPEHIALLEMAKLRTCQDWEV